MLTRIVSGGQTGVDRAALDVALELGLACGGWCPRGRKAEDGPIDARYPLAETPWDGYPQRTEWNVRDSDATLILTLGEPDRGTLLTRQVAEKGKKPCLAVDLAGADVGGIRDWLTEHCVSVLNVAGSRESSSPGIHARARELLLCLLRDEAGERRGLSPPA
jgi:hypothetical protein